MKRECGDCIVCCVYHRIPQLNKPPMTHCENLDVPGPIEPNMVYYTGPSKRGNCTIYKERPKVCQEYQCAWRQGYGGDEDRPDRCLMMFDNIHEIENAIKAKPLKDGQELTKEGKAVIARMSTSTGKPIIVLDFYERKIQSVAGLPILPLDLE